MSDHLYTAESPTSSLDTARIEQRLREQLERSEKQLIGLESVLSDMLREHDTIQEDRDATSLLVDSLREDVRKIQNALTRMANGTFGHCTNCRFMIAPERIEAIPTATHCARCA